VNAGFGINVTEEIRKMVSRIITMRMARQMLEKHEKDVN
jgi:hypothetical protein